MANAGQPRCQMHATQRNAAGYARKRERRASAPGNGAARRLRRAINSAGWASCAHCHAALPARCLEVDHITPLVDGGADVEQNLQPLCRGCHAAKTTNEARSRRSQEVPTTGPRTPRPQACARSLSAGRPLTVDNSGNNARY